jgi:hypothetical protein
MIIVINYCDMDFLFQKKEWMGRLCRPLAMCHGAKEDICSDSEYTMNLGINSVLRDRFISLQNFYSHCCGVDC